MLRTSVVKVLGPRAVWRAALALLAIGAVWTRLSADEPAADPPAAEEAAEEVADEVVDDSNPYLAREDLTAQELLDFIERMELKPKTIRQRPGFAEAVLEAAERVLSAEVEPALKNQAELARLRMLHADAASGNAQSDQRLIELAEPLVDCEQADVAQQARFYMLEQRLLKADDLPPEQLASLLDELRLALADRELDGRHLRLASATVRVINRLPDDDAAAKAYREFGELFAASEDRELSRYGRKIEKGVKPATLVGKPFELAGQAVDGSAVDWASYRGKVVLVDFWATWCGPCRQELPNVKQQYEAYHDKGFDVIGVSLDTDREALEQFLTQEQIAWVNLFSDNEQANGWKHPLAVKYSVQAIPATFLVDKEGKVIAENVRGPELGKRLEQLLGPPAATP